MDKLNYLNDLRRFIPLMEGNGGAGGGGTPPADPPGGADPKPPADLPPEPQTFDAVLKNKEFQAEFDRRLQKGILTAVTKERERQEALADERISEAEKLSKMTELERKEYKQKKATAELEQREKDLARREMMAEAKAALAEKQLPVALADVLDYSDADKCKGSIEVVEHVFRDSVQQAVEEKLKGGKPPKAPETEDITKEEYSKLGYEEKLKLKMEKPELYKQLSGK
ncbi:DUF4355 domain-containing protein [Hominibacterium faecale]|uniref:DUF4355 domain-containing protein n=1 Tax=Hominibacterium faecale TaxID=2839743 RepID=UPI0022B29D00|nr:DUF4355 domain-containing protein [Hominibacterium faecale]